MTQEIIILSNNFKNIHSIFENKKCVIQQYDGNISICKFLDEIMLYKYITNIINYYKEHNIKIIFNPNYLNGEYKIYINDDIIKTNKQYIFNVYNYDNNTIKKLVENDLLLKDFQRTEIGDYLFN